MATTLIASVRHDLVKRALWAARDLETIAATGDPEPGDLRALERALCAVPDDEGRPVGATTRWQAVCAGQGVPPEAARAFGAALETAEAAARDLTANPARWPEAVRAALALEPALAALAAAVTS